MSLAINLATRQRPELAFQTLQTTLSNIRDPKTAVLLSVDDDDPESVQFPWPSLNAEDGLGRVLTCCAPREDDLGSKYNRVLQYYSDYSVFMPLVDYTPQITPGFDIAILEAAKRFPDGIGVVRNGYANLSFPKSQAITGRLASMLGFLWPPYFPYWFGDHWIDDIALYTGRYSFADFQIAISPRPARYAASPQVATMEYREVNFWSSLFDLGYVERERQATQIITSPNFEAPQWQKELLIANFPLVREHSRLINMAVRQQGIGTKPTSPPDDRYQRLRNKAQLLAAEWLNQINEAQP